MTIEFETKRRYVAIILGFGGRSEKRLAWAWEPFSGIVIYRFYPISLMTWSLPYETEIGT